MMKIKHSIGLTGSTGMMGKHLIHFFSKKNIKILATTNKLPKYKNKNVQFKKLNLNTLKDEKQLDSIFKNIKTLIHLGALVPKPDFSPNKKEIFKTNFRSTSILANWAKKNDVHFVFLSGAIVYKNNDSKKNNEFSLLNNNFKIDYYGQSKKDSDVYLFKKIIRGDKITILRPTSIYGYGQVLSKIINRLIKFSKSNKLIELSEPFEKINFIHAYDVVNAIYESIIRKEYGVFNIGSKKLYTIKDLSKILIEINKSESKIKIVKQIKKTNTLYKYNVSSLLAEKKLNWFEKIYIKKGLKLVINKQYG